MLASTFTDEAPAVWMPETKPLPVNPACSVSNFAPPARMPSSSSKNPSLTGAT